MEDSLPVPGLALDPDEAERRIRDRFTAGELHLDADTLEAVFEYISALQYEAARGKPPRYRLPQALVLQTVEAMLARLYRLVSAEDLA